MLRFLQEIINKKITGGVNHTCTVAQWQMNGANSPL